MHIWDLKDNTNIYRNCIHIFTYHRRENNQIIHCTDRFTRNDRHTHYVYEWIQYKQHAPLHKIKKLWKETTQQSPSQRTSHHLSDAVAHKKQCYPSMCMGVSTSSRLATNLSMTYHTWRACVHTCLQHEFPIKIHKHGSILNSWWVRQINNCLENNQAGLVQ